MNYYIHLTNNAVQEYCPMFGNLIKGNIFPLSTLQDQVRQDRPGVPEGFFMKQIVEHIRLVFDATHEILNPRGREFCFELFGFDFMIDDDLKVWLIEVNSGPSLSESNKFLSKLLHRMMGSLTLL